ncbi:hypothetical protein Tco_0535525 [Tanacetum coccineum]
MIWALNVDPCLENDQCDASTLNVDEAPTHRSMFMANLSSEIEIYVNRGHHILDTPFLRNKVYAIATKALYVVHSCGKATVQPALYNGHVLVMSNHARPVVHDSEDIHNNDRKKAETSVLKTTFEALAVYPPNTPVKLVPRVLPTKVKKNLLIANENLIANCLSNQLVIEDLKAQLEGNMKVAALRNKFCSKTKFLLLESVETVKEIVEEARVVKPLDNALNYACQYTKLSQELIEYVIGTCPKEFTERDSKAPSIPLTRKKQERILSGKLNCGYQWRPTGKKFALGELCPLTRLPVTCGTDHPLVSGLRLFKTRFRGMNGSWLAPSLCPATTYIPPTDKDLEILFQPMFDEYFDQSTDSEPVPTATVVNALIVSTNTSVSTTIAQDATSIKSFTVISQVILQSFLRRLVLIVNIRDVRLAKPTNYKDGKVRSKCENKGIVPTEMELVLEYTQQGASHEVSDHLKMEMEMEIPSSSNVKLITECSDTTYTCYEVMKDLIKVSKLPQTLISYSSSQVHKMAINY